MALSLADIEKELASRQQAGNSGFDEIDAELKRRGVNTDQGSFQEAKNVMSSDQSKTGKAWDMLNVPSQMSSRGLQGLAGMVPQPEPTGNLPMDLIKGTPKIAADTLAEAAPSFINRTSMLLGGAAKAAKAVSPLARAVGSGVANQAEQITGSVPGSVKAAFNDPTLIFAKGKKAASPLYEAAKTSEVAKQLSKIPEKDKFIQVADDLADKGVLPPESALEGRKIADKLLSKGGGKFQEDYLRGLRNKFDEIAKSNENIAKADPMFNRGRMAESLRNLMPQNKHGGASAFKMGIMAGLEQMGIPGKVALAAMSPAVSGAAATAGGMATRAAGPVITNSQASVSLKNLIQKLIEKNNKRRNQ